MEQEIKTYEALGQWIRIQLFLKRTTMREFADEIGIAYPRISEAIHGKPSGIKHLPKIVTALGGDLHQIKIEGCCLCLKN